MVSSMDPNARRFVREATVGLVIIACLLATIVYGTARRFGFWQQTPKPDRVVAAKVFRSAPQPGEEGADTVPIPQGRRMIAERSQPSGFADDQPSGAASTAPHSPRQVASSDRHRPQVSTPATHIETSDPPAGAATGFQRLDASGQVAAGGPARLSPPLPQDTGSQNSSSGGNEGVGGASQLVGRELPGAAVSPLSGQRSLGGEESESVPKPRRSLPVLNASTTRPGPAAEVPERPDPKWSIRPSDTLWDYTSRNYGDPQWFRAVAAWLKQQGVVFEELSPGRVVRPPSKQQLTNDFPQLVPQSLERPTGEPPLADSTYVTTGSESLFDIAARWLGQAARYVEIVELNRERIPADWDFVEPLPKGTRLVLPPR